MNSNHSLTISKCINCGNKVWPQQKYCNLCFNKTCETELVREGRIIECSQKDDQYFCIGEFDGIRIICNLKSKTEPKVGQKITFLNHKKTDAGDMF